LIIITDKAELARDLDDNPIIIPSNGPLTALGAVVPLQLIAYELSVLRYVSMMHDDFNPYSCDVLSMEYMLYITRSNNVSYVPSQRIKPGHSSKLGKIPRINQRSIDNF
jgi:hypothetical protein